jgi:hypothetical protein
MRQRDKEPRLQEADTPWKHENIQRGLLDDFWTAVREAISWNFHRVAENEGLDIVEGSTLSETESKTAH